jgi:hypothetical protein
LGFPEGAIAFDPGGGVFHGLGRKAAVVDAALNLALQQAGEFENAKVFGDGGKRDVEGSGQLGDGGFAEREAGQDGAAGGVGESAEGGVQRGLGGGMINHMV